MLLWRTRAREGELIAALTAGAAYFAVVFLVGFVLGTMRVLVVAPRLGDVAAVLIETPIILWVSWLACGWSAARFGVGRSVPDRLAMGTVAFALLMSAEAGLSVLIFHRSLAEHLAGYRSLSGAIGLAAQVVFAWLPLAQARRRRTPL